MDVDAGVGSFVVAAAESPKLLYMNVMPTTNSLVVTYDMDLTSIS